MAGHVSHRLAGARAGYRARFSHRLAMPLYWGKSAKPLVSSPILARAERGISLGSLLYCNGETDTIEPRDTPTAQEQVTANPKK